MGKSRRWDNIESERNILLRFPSPAWDIPLIPPIADICDEPTVCISLNLEWATYLSGLIEAAKHPGYWDTDAAGIYRIEQSLNRVIEQMVIPCSQPGNSVTLGEATTLLDSYVADYDGVPTSLNNFGPLETFDSNSNDDALQAHCRSFALCMASEVWVKGAAQIESSRRNAGGSFFSQMSFLPSVLLLLVPNPASWLAFGAAMGAWMFNEGQKIFQQLSDEVLGDVCAQHEVACCLAANLAGLAPTLANFCGSLDTCTGLSDNAEQIRGALAYMTCQLSGFVLFLGALGTAQVSCAFAEDATCGCGRWCHLFDFTVEDGGFTQAEASGGVWTAGVGWVYQDHTGIGQPAKRQVHITRFTADHNWKYAEIVFEYQFGHVEGSNPPTPLAVAIGGITPIFAAWGEIPNGMVRKSASFAATQGGMDIRILSSWDNVSPKTLDGSVIVKSLKVAGCGTNPFASCNTCLPPVIDCP